MAGLADLLVEKGLVTRAELSREAVPAVSDLADKAWRKEQITGILEAGGPADRPSDVKPVFKPGDAVMTRKIAANVSGVDGGHTRLPIYAAGAKGRIVMLHGSHVLPDSSAHGLGDAAEPLYAVAFAASELWEHPEHPRDEVVLDLWQSYLAPA